jgi:hypothetical protein
VSPDFHTQDPRGSQQPGGLALSCVILPHAPRRRWLQTRPADREGTELIEKTPQKQGVADEGGAESGALGAENRPEDPDLGAVVDAWATLPETIKAGILAMVRAAGDGSEG